MPIWTVQLILEQLVNGTPPKEISPNIASQDAVAILGVKFIVQDLSSINFIRSCRTVLQIIFETLVAYCIGKVDKRDQLLSNGTGTRQTDLHNLVIGVINE